VSKTLMVILQNAYGVEEGYEPSYDKSSFASCHTGIRLNRAIPDNVSIHIINANPSIGTTADSFYPPNSDHISRRISRIKPDIILACGVSAKKGIDSINVNVPVIKMPHPAYRALTNKTLDDVKEQIGGYT
jgi:hypothetical protein